MAVRGMEVVLRAVEVRGHHTAEIGAVLAVVGLAELDPGDLGHRIGFVRRLERSGEQLPLADRLRGEGPFVKGFPGGERTPTLAEITEIQDRLTKAGFDTGGVDGRVGSDTMKAVRDYQRKAGLEPADGYAGLKVLARLRQGT